MISPDSNADVNASKYHVQIGEGKGIVIGDNAQVVQQFYDTHTEPQVDLTAAEATYRQKVVDVYKWLNFSGFDSPDLSLANVPLEDVFVRLSLTVEKVIREPVPSEKSSKRERDESRQRERVITVQEPVELGQALSNHLLIVGEPGAGKSTLLRWLAVIFAQGYQREPNRLGPSADADRLPVLVELGRLPDRYVKPEGGETPNWIQFLPEYLTAQIAFTDTPPQLLTQALADGRCLLMFDGLDEVADRQVRARLARSLVELARLSPGNRVIIGSRPAGVSESALRPQFHRCQIERFTPEDVQRFFGFWYALDRSLTPEQQHDAADTLYTRVQTTPATLQLATTPLLSTILVLIWRNEGDLPERRVELYERCCRLLIERWEASHDVAYQGALVSMDWEDHLRLLTPLAFAIHSQKQRSATREELVPLFTHALQNLGYANEQAAATREAKQFLDALGLRSGLLQYMGKNEMNNDLYGFPHQTFQEYLAARYIATQPDPEYIDLVMEHLHEAWWQQVHLLTIAHLGSGKVGASKASTLLLTIMHVYAPPSRILRSSSNRWLRLIGPGKFFPQAQLERRLAWVLAREFELAVMGYAECAPNGMKADLNAVLSVRAASLVRDITHDMDRYAIQRNLLIVTGQLLQQLGNEAVVRALLETLHDTNHHVRRAAAGTLGQGGIGNETVVRALLETLHDKDRDVRREAVISLGQVGIGNEAVASALLETLHDANHLVRREAVISLGQVGIGNEAVVSALLETTLHDMDTQNEAIASLGQLGMVGNEVVVNTLLEALHDESGDIQWTVIDSLGQLGVGNETVASALLGILHDAIDHDESDFFGRMAAASLGRVGVRNEAVMHALLETLHDKDRYASYVRREAAISLGRLGVGNEAVRVLLEALHDENADVHDVYMVAETLGQLNIGNEAVVSALQEALHDKDRNVQREAAASLGRLGMGNEAAVRVLLEALNTGIPDRIVAASKSLGQVGIGNEEVVRVLLEALHSKYRNVQHEAAISLGQLGVGNEEVVRVLLEAVHDGKWNAAASLEQLRVGSKAVASLLLEALHDKDRDVRNVAAISLGRLERKETVQLLQMHQILVAINRRLHDFSGYTRQAVLASSHQLLDGRPFPDYRWVSLRKRRARRLRLKRIAFWLGMTVLIMLIGLAVAWLLGTLDPNGFPARFLAALAGSVAFVAAAAQVLGRTLRDPWEHS